MAASLKCPWPYSGGKSRVSAEVWQRLGNPSVYIEPFAGSLAALPAAQVATQFARRPVRGIKFIGVARDLAVKPSSERIAKTARTMDARAKATRFRRQMESENASAHPVGA